MNNEPDYPPEATDALIDAVPDDPYKPCPCGCGIKMRFIIKNMAEDEHVKRFCDNQKRKWHMSVFMKMLETILSDTFTNPEDTGKIIEMVEIDGVWTMLRAN